MRTLRSRRRFTALPRLEVRTPLVAMAVATTVVEEASVWLGAPLPSRYAAGLAHRARRCYAHCASFRRRVDRHGTAGRETLYVFMRHWLCARLHEERPDLLARLPADYRTGAELPPPTLTAPVDVPLLSNDARLLAAF